jgi:hypothetical protein
MKSVGNARRAVHVQGDWKPCRVTKNSEIILRPGGFLIHDQCQKTNRTVPYLILYNLSILSHCEVGSSYSTCTTRGGRQNIFIKLDVQIGCMSCLAPRKTKSPMSKSGTRGGRVKPHNCMRWVRLNPLIPENPVHKPKYDWAPPRAHLEVVHLILWGGHRPRQSIFNSEMIQ